MNDFCISLAGIPIGITCQFSKTVEYCKNYLCDETPCISVEISMDDILRERQISGSDRYSDAYLETLALYRKICDALIWYDVVLFHGSLIDVDGSGYLFTGSSGTGKSTHAAIWRQVLPPLGHSVRMINDDKPLIRFADDGIFGWGTPWSGKHRLETNDRIPLRAIGLIIRSQENRVEAMPEEAFWPMVLRQCHLPDDPTAAKRVLELLQRLHDQIPCYRIFCNMETEAAIISWQGMSEEKGKK